MELRHLRYFVAVGEEEHYGRGAQRLRVAQPALSRQIQDLEEEIGFKLFDRLARGVQLTSAGKLFLDEVRRLLQQVDDATTRARSVATGQSGTLRVGFIESMSWHGIVPDSFREFRTQQPEVELQIKPLSSAGQVDAVRSGELDAGFVFTLARMDRELVWRQIAEIGLMLAVPKGHSLARTRRINLRNLNNVSFIWFPRRESPFFYDQLMHACFRGGLKSPRIVQEGVNEATILSLVSCGLGVAFVSAATRWRCPESVVLVEVSDLKLPLPFALIWRKGNHSPLLHRFVENVSAKVRASGE